MNPRLDRRVTQLMVMFVVAFVLHEAEEWNLVTWLRENFEPEPGFNDLEARILLAFISLLGGGFAGVVIRIFQPRIAATILVPLFIAPIVGNALTHVFWLFYFQSYAPGVVTSAVLLLPTAFYLGGVLIRTRFIPRWLVFLSAAMSLAPPFGAFVAGASLSDQQVSLQRFGARLASWLWGAV